MSISYEARKRFADARLAALLDPKTALEERTVVWLCDWDLETVERLATMIERSRDRDVSDVG